MMFSPSLDQDRFVKPSRNTRAIRQVVASCLIVVCFVLLLRTFGPGRIATAPTVLLSSTPKSHSQSKYAFVLFVADYSSDDDRPDEDDHYYIGSRVLIHQLLHDPETRTNTSIPVVVLATKDVKPHRIDRLIKDGADVRIVEKIPPPTWPEEKWNGNPRWADAYAKLRTFQLVEFEKVLFLDSDMMVVKRMDGIFDDPATDIIDSDPSRVKDDEGEVPARYMVAAQPAFERRQHSYPPEPMDSGDMSSGFYVCHPSLESFNHYMNLMQIPDRLRLDSQDQDLMHYAHRRDGPMPWIEFDYKWTTTWPSMKEYKMGAHTLHEKWWADRVKELSDMDPFLQEMWMKQKFQMEVRTAMSDLAR